MVQKKINLSALSALSVIHWYHQGMTSRELGVIFCTADASYCMRINRTQDERQGRENSFILVLCHLIIMREFARGFYNTVTWQNVREMVMKRDHWLCQDCLGRGMYKGAEEVHHIIPLTPENIGDTSITLNPDNLIALCRDCHRLRHIELYKGTQHIGSRRLRRFKFDEWGHVLVKEDPPLSSK